MTRFSPTLVNPRIEGFEKPELIITRASIKPGLGYYLFDTRGFERGWDLHLYSRGVFIDKPRLLSDNWTVKTASVRYRDAEHERQQPGAYKVSDPRYWNAHTSKDNIDFSKVLLRDTMLYDLGITPLSTLRWEPGMIALADHKRGCLVGHDPSPTLLISELKGLLRNHLRSLVTAL